MKTKDEFIKIDSKKIGSESGFSLLEVIVAMVIFLIVTSSIYGLLAMSSTSRNRSSRRTDVLKNARTAVHLIGRDALNAGLGYHQKGAMVPDGFLSSTLGLPTDSDSDRDILTSVIAGNDIFPNDLLDNSSDRTDIIAFAYRDLDFNSGDAMAINGPLAGSSPDTARLGIDDNEAGSASTYDLFLVEAGNSQMAAMVSSVPNNSNIDFAPSDPLGINLPYNVNSVDGSLMQPCNPPTVIEHCTTQLSSAKRFFWVSYKVKQDGTLVRIVYGNNRGNPFDKQIQESPLAYNVKNLQFKYVLKDGTVTDNPIAGPDGVAGTTDDLPNNFNLIRQITVSIEVQSTENDEQTGLPEVIKLDATFNARNLQYDVG